MTKEELATLLEQPMFSTRKLEHVSEYITQSAESMETKADKAMTYVMAGVLLNAVSDAIKETK